MLIKSADDKSKRLALLEDLQKSSLLDARQKEWLRVELRNLAAGIKGEREAAFHLYGHYKDGQNNVLRPNRRIQIDSETAQTDRLDTIDRPHGADRGATLEIAQFGRNSFA